MHQKKMSAGISRHINGTINASKLSRQFIQLSFNLSDRAFAHGLVFPAHSDEIVQVFHLFPFYLMSACSHELFHSGSSTGCLFDCYGRYFNITEIIMQ